MNQQGQSLAGNAVGCCSSSCRAIPLAILQQFLIGDTGRHVYMKCSQGVCCRSDIDRGGGA